MLNIDYEDRLFQSRDQPDLISQDDREELLAYLLTDNFLDALLAILVGLSEQSQKNKLHDVFTILVMDPNSAVAATDTYYKEEVRLELRDQLRDTIENPVIAGRRFAEIVLERIHEDLHN